MKSLSIALIIDDKFPSSSGVSRSVQTQIEELTRLSHKVTLLAPYDNLEVPRQAKTIPVNSFRLPGLPIHTRILYATNHTASLQSCSQPNRHWGLAASRQNRSPATYPAHSHFSYQYRRIAHSTDTDIFR